MKILILLVLVSLGIALVFLAVFYWCVRSGQYDDTQTPSIRILFDNDKPRMNQGGEKKTNKTT